ncbi:undecaprenyl-diphosphate phosphatase [Phototrophicus methaneseepsis]|uniref:Undecaprenyl-diphosphatase n=1 Tax=Phototrophicus methaneseepsis TaxID=2710758 RepID=A0A7S8E774_9CHLR|nr:undecaprenyl-diphosphate phosphatase [Phototrophicus methaneseepsis]QPC81640.1 undecaprenyl-diphosphate phosphatase [Phototrophicus methaneseepsis]
MEEWIKVVILGIVEGLTEFLPVSSTGHLIVVGNFLQLRESLNGVFEIFIQIGAVVAVIVYYWPDLWRQARTITRDSSVQQLWLGIFVAFVPAAVIGLLFDDMIEELLFRPEVVALALIVGGIMFIVIEQWIMPRQVAKRAVAGASSEGTVAGDTAAERTDDLKSVTLRQSLMIGLWQLLALIPGMSRSGMSIIGGMLSGLSREVATQFSFYLALPTLGAATIYTLLRSLDEISGNDLGLLILGAVISGIVAGASIAWLLRYVARNNFIPFGIYRILVGIVILVLVAMNSGVQ